MFCLCWDFDTGSILTIQLETRNLGNHSFKKMDS